ncbi:hypothetical protein D9756_006826 [Leucocoprinus leucothites]|uniref:Uncharacterized protein n=1 Tax=Leucocoprinus leucothites TaxID=201217 RepID=A0A8H5G1W1_9AGAR|nr:hypothetical protein D9756_006826 [Leucoagaricus leucothites]
MLVRSKTTCNATPIPQSAGPVDGSNSVLDPSRGAAQPFPDINSLNTAASGIPQVEPVIPVVESTIEQSEISSSRYSGQRPSQEGLLQQLPQLQQRLQNMKQHVQTLIPRMEKLEIQGLSEQLRERLGQLRQFLEKQREQLKSRIDLLDAESKFELQQRLQAIRREIQEFNEQFASQAPALRAIITAIMQQIKTELGNELLNLTG